LVLDLERLEGETGERGGCDFNFPQRELGEVTKGKNGGTTKPGGGLAQSPRGRDYNG